MESNKEDSNAIHTSSLNQFNQSSSQIKIEYTTEQRIDFTVPENNIDNLKKERNPDLYHVKMEFETEETIYCTHLDNSIQQMNPPLLVEKCSDSSVSDSAIDSDKQESKFDLTCSKQLSLPLEKAEMKYHIEDGVHFMLQRNKNDNSLHNVNQCLKQVKLECKTEETNNFTEKESKEYNHDTLHKERNRLSELVKTEGNEDFIMDYDELQCKSVEISSKQIGIPLEKLRKEYNTANIKFPPQEGSTYDQLNSGNQMQQELEQLFHCSKCNFQTNMKRKLTSHLKIKHSEGKKKHKINKKRNSVCTDKNNFTFKNCVNKLALNTHLQRNLRNSLGNKKREYQTNCNNDKVLPASDPVEPEFNYTECDYNTNKQNRFLLHINKHSGEYKFHCMECQYKTNISFNFQCHISKHSGDYKFLCSECDYKTNNNSHLQCHIKNHSRVYKFHCTECAYKSNNNYNFQCHLSKHSGYYKFHCTNCEYKTNFNSNFQRHINHHAGDYKLNCTECKYKTNDKFHFKDHISKHSGDYKFHCTVCEHKTNSNSNFQRHISKHCEDYKFYCTECEYKTNDKFHFKDHISKHSGDYRFRCTDCKYKTNNASHFKYHASTHSGEYKFHCTQCKSKTNSNTVFQRHISKHSRDKLHCAEYESKTNDNSKF